MYGLKVFKKWAEVRSRKEKNKGNEWLWKRKSWIKKGKVVQEVKGGESESESAGPWGDICVCSSIRDQLSEVTWAGKTRTLASTASLSHFPFPSFFSFSFVFHFVSLRPSAKLSGEKVCARQSYNRVSFISILEWVISGALPLCQQLIIQRYQKTEACPSGQNGHLPNGPSLWTHTLSLQWLVQWRPALSMVLNQWWFCPQKAQYLSDLQ